MRSDFLAAATASVPAGRWAVAVSGGADSVALLMLLQARPDLTLRIVHLNHQLRGEESDGDADFVRDLAARLNLPVTIMRREELTTETTSKNPSEQYRRARLAMYGLAVEEHALDGVLLAHHLDDQIETVLHRLLRGSGYRGLCGMETVDCVAGVVLRRALLAVPRAVVRDHLEKSGQAWREDSSNTTANYRRNVLRQFLADRPGFGAELLTLMHACRELRNAVDAAAADWPAELVLRSLRSQAKVLQEQSARAWLARAEVPAARIDAQTISRLLMMTRDAATAARLQLPGGKEVVRQGGKMIVR